MKVSGNYAIVEASGKQLWVEADHYYDLNRLPFNTGDEIILNRVYLHEIYYRTYLQQPKIISTFNLCLLLRQ